MSAKNENFQRQPTDPFKPKSTKKLKKNMEYEVEFGRYFQPGEKVKLSISGDRIRMEDATIKRVK